MGEETTSLQSDKVKEILSSYPDLLRLHVVVRRIKKVHSLHITGINQTGFTVTKNMTAEEFKKKYNVEMARAFFVEINLTLDNAIPTLQSILSKLEVESPTFPGPKNWAATAYTIYPSGLIEVNTTMDDINFPNWNSRVN